MTGLPTIKIKAEFPEKAMGLFHPSPYKVLWGGRSSTKSWDVGRALLIIGANRPMFWLCAREIQKSIDESVHKLLSDQIIALGFHEHYDAELDQLVAARYIVRDTEIIGTNGTRFVFAGLRNHITAIKSMEGLDGCWVEEADLITHASWETLIPTLRKGAPGGPFGQGAELWITFNPELASSYTYKYWVIDPPEGTIKINMNWRDNPWFSDVSRRQKDDLRKRDVDAYMTVWEGKPRRVLAGAIYAKELSKAIEDGRVSPDIQPIRGKPVTVTFDLGRADMTSMWFIQQVGTSHFAIDFYENCGFDITHYLEVMQERKYVYGSILLPHDAVQQHVSAKASVEAQVRAAYPNIVKVVPRVARRAIRINAMRQLFPRMSFGERTCEQGLLSLQHYQFGVNEKDKKRTEEPLHNWACHAADSLGTYAQELIEGPALEKAAASEEDMYDHHNHGQAWMQ